LLVSVANFSFIQAVIVIIILINVKTKHSGIAKH